MALGESHRFLESLPYFRRALEVPPEVWQPHSAYAVSLFHATHQVRDHRGRVTPVTRSSYERAQMMREAQRQLGIAESLAKTPQEQAFILEFRAQQLAVWGLLWNAAGAYAQASAVDSLARLRASALVGEMKDPVGTVPAPDSIP